MAPFSRSRSGRARRPPQPAGGHLEAGETLGCRVAETLEERGHRVAPPPWFRHHAGRRREHCDVPRFAFTGEIVAHEADRALDVGILRALWLPYDELVARSAMHRSPLVLRCVDDYRAGARRPLDFITEM
jgi:8-oxo-dGTP pyrophosphatase MutT (NUDIX family)